jgi:Fe2+ transport system protein FeoA
MKLSPAALAIALVVSSIFGANTTSNAAPPQINGISPFGLTRGVATELTVNGGNLGGNPRLIAPIAITLSETVKGSDAANWKVRLLVDPSTPVGVYPVRVQTDEGPSNPILLSVGQLPQVIEKEDNSAFELAQAFTIPAVVEGQTPGNDVDYFRFAGKKGQKLVVDAQCARIGSTVDPTIRLTTVAHVFVASADDSPGLRTDARMITVLPEDADYVIEISDTRYQGGARPIYRLVVGDLPIADEVYPLGGRKGETVGLELRGGTLNGVTVSASTLRPQAGTSLDHVRALIGAPFDVESLPALIVSEYAELREPSDPSAAPVRGLVPVVFNGRIDPPGNEDRFVLAVTPGQRIRVEVDASEIGSALDGVLQVLGANGTVIATNDDTSIPDPKQPQNAALRITSSDPSLEFTVPGGLTEVTLTLRDLESRGGTGFPYRITAAPVGPDFELILNQSETPIPKGGTTQIGVTVVRKAGFNGPIELGVKDLPAGLTVRPGRINDGQAVGVLSVSAAPDAAFPALYLAVTGTSQIPAGPIVHPASKTIVFALQANVPTNSATQTGLVVAPTPELPVVLDSPAGKVTVVHGFSAPVPITAKRSAGGEGALDLVPLAPLPPGLTVPNVKLAEKAAEAAVTVNTTTDLPVGSFTFGLIAKGKLGGADRTVAVPVVMLDVVRPATVELAAASLEVKAGATVEVKGKVVRNGPFKEPVAVKVNGLPAGLKADPVTVAPDAKEFTLKIVAEPNAAPATGGATVALAFQVNKKDYPAQTAPLAVKVLPAK